jgi:hypothetical protein
MTMKTQLITLLQKRWVSPLEALRLVGCMSLAQRCSEMRRDGLIVFDRWIELPNGKRCKEYRLFRGKGAA